MGVSKNINIAEYQKCGELMVAVKRNKFAMSCKFCQQIFTQLQAFMRHLQLQHNDKLEFVKESQEVEVYAVEELMNQTTASCSPDLESEESNFVGDEDSKWLTEQDVKWLKNGEEPAKLKKTECIKNDVGEDDLGLANMSILKALKDCDVSFNFMDTLNSTKCSEDKEEQQEDNDLNNTLLREIENEWQDNDSNDNEPNKIDCTITDLANCSKRLLDLRKELDLDVTLTDVINQSNILEEEDLKALNEKIEKSPAGKIKNLLEGLDDLEDIDSLLENLEGASKNEEKEDEKDSISRRNKDQEKFKVKDELNLNNKKMLLNDKLANKANNKVDNKKIKNVKVEAESRTLNDFERRLKQLEDDLDEDNDIIYDNNVDDNNIKIESQKFTKEHNDFASKLKDLEDSLNDFEPKNKISSSFELKLKDLEDSLEDEDIEEEIANKIMEKKVNSVLNKDLTKALADALDDDNLDLLDLQTEEDLEEPLNQDLLNLLDQELNDHEAGKEINNILNSQTAEDLVESKISQSCKKTKNSHKTIVKTKYQKTNLKAKTKLNKNVIKTCSVLKEANQIQKSGTNNKSMKSQQVPLKANHNIFRDQYQSTVMNMLLQQPTKPEINIISLKSPEKSLTQNRLRKTPNKENQENKTPSLNILNIKKEKLTPANNFINTERGDKTPLKHENIFLKQSPKTQEKQENLIENKTPKRSNKTPQSRVMKQSPKTQEKQENLNPVKTPTENKHKTPTLKGNLKQSPKTQEKQEHFNTLQTPTNRKQKTPQSKRTRNIKSSPKTQEKQTPNHNNKKTPKTPENTSPTVTKETKSRSPLKSLSKSNEKPGNNTNTSPKLTKEIQNGLGTHLTTPQRLKNVAIKLHRYTPDKLPRKLTKSQTKSTETSPQNPLDKKAKELMEHFKLPQGIVLTKIPSQTSNNAQDGNQSEIIETPIKPTYCKQNFNESTLEPVITLQEIPKKSPEVKENPTSLIQPQNHIIQNLKTEALNSKIRQRKASIDIIPPSQNIQPSATNKTPRHSNLDYKSYAVNRSARKKEVLQRMRHIKKQIFKSIENGECVTKKIQRLKSPLLKPQRKRKIFIENIQILPNLDKDALTPLIKPLNDFEKPLDSNTNTPNPNVISTQNLADDQKQAKINSNSYKFDSPINDDEKLIKKSLKRPASSPLSNEHKPAKRHQKSPAKNDNQLKDKDPELEATQLDLSESVVDFLQRDLKANRLNVDSFLNEELPVDDIAPDETSLESNAKESKNENITKDGESTNNSNLINDLLDQVESEMQTNEKLSKDTPNANDDTLKDDDDNDIDFDEDKDISLLDKVGLKIIKCPDLEDTICLEERDKNMEKAKKFSKMLKNWPKIWCTKNFEGANLKEGLEISFHRLLNETNLTFNLRLSLTEMKRLVNLINLWYGHNINNKLIEKRKIEDSTNRYLKMFNFIPKTAKRFCYCEYCEEYFNTEHKYFTHRIVHTGALHPYECRKCSAGFKNVKFMKNHEAICDKSKKSNNLKTIQITYENPKNRLHKCEICSETFASSDLLYDHSKKHLKTIYNCAKCELVFASALDVQIHMSTCNTITKRMPKQCTPRPAKTKTDKHIDD